MTISRVHIGYAVLVAVVLLVGLTTRVWLGWMLTAWEATR